jgi:MSHA biogenesis protein MshJ
MMKARWQALEAKFQALQKREKIIVAAAAVLGVLLIGFNLWVDPASSRLSKLDSKLAKDRIAVQNGQSEVAAMTARLQDVDASNKAALAEVKNKMAAIEQDLRNYERMLVPPDRVQELLRSLLSRHRGLTLVSLRTLTSEPLVSPHNHVAEAKPGAPAKTAEAKAGDTKPPVAAKGAIYKQGMEIKISGNYLDLLSYVSDMERLPQKLLWGGMALTVGTYPNSELTLTVYSLSPDSKWLVL